MASQTIDLEEIRHEPVYDDHLIPLERLYRRYATNPKYGLSQDEVRKRLERDGPNTLLRVEGIPWWKILYTHMFGMFPLLLWAAAILCIATYGVETAGDPEGPKDDLYLGLLIICVILMSGFFGFFQERRSSNIMSSFLRMTQPTTHLLRGGRIVVVPADQVVVGDVVVLTAGDCVPADMRAFECQGGKVDASPLTGETEPSAVSAWASNRDPLRSPNVVFFSTHVTEGTIKGIVFRTGINTYIGRVAALTASLSPGETVVDRDINHFIFVVLVVAIIFNSIMFIVTLAVGFKIVDSVVFVLGMMVANVPEALPLTVTVSLALTAQRMAEKNCLVKTLKAVVMLGSTTVICSDKTGTLTMNRMTVVGVYYNKKEVDVQTQVPHNDADFDALILAATLCNRATFEDGQNRKAIGDASESAIITFVEDKVDSVISMREANKKVYEEAFTSAKKYQITVHEMDAKPGVFLIAVKGAPEMIMDMCDKMLLKGKEVPISASMATVLSQAFENMAGRGQRVLGVAHAEMNATDLGQDSPFETTIPRKGLVLLGFIALEDPPRESVPKAVAMCRKAGIKIIMVTGDHPTTAASIADEVGIFSSKGETAGDVARRLRVPMTDVSPEVTPRLVMTGNDLAVYDHESLATLIRRFPEIVFARTSPTQKLYIVEIVQSLGNIVTVTGDGVNDAPALKVLQENKADVGVAMGINGTDVAKEAADMILLDDDFSSIVAAVEQGRVIFDNLQKSTAFVLTSNTPEIVPFLLQVSLGIPPPLTIILVMIIDVVTDVWPSIALAYEAAEKDVMTRDPRDHNKERLVTTRLMAVAYLQIGMVQAAAAMCTYFVVMMDHGFWPQDLLYVHERWIDPKVTVLDSYGKAWTEPERVVLTQRAQSATYLAIAWTQLADMFISRSRRDSLLSRPWSGWPIMSATILQVVGAGLAVYCPGANSVIRTQPVPPVYWLPGVVFTVLLVVADELRRAYIRGHPNSWVLWNTYY